MTFSDVVASLSFVLAAVTYIHTAISRKNMKEWRKQRLSEKQAEIALEALTFVSRLANFLIARTIEVERPDASSQANIHRNWESLKVVFENFASLRISVEAHTPNAAVGLEEMRQCAEQLWLCQHEAVSDPTKIEDAYGDRPTAKIAVIRERAKGLFMPYTRLE